PADRVPVLSAAAVRDQPQQERQGGRDRGRLVRQRHHGHRGPAAVPQAAEELILPQKANHRGTETQRRQKRESGGLAGAGPGVGGADPRYSFFSSLLGASVPLWLAPRGATGCLAAGRSWARRGGSRGTGRSCSSSMSPMISSRMSSSVTNPSTVPCSSRTTAI